jgi:hypothetical protein
VRREWESLALHVLISLAVVVAAWAVCRWSWPEGGPARQTAMTGLWMAAGSGALSLALFHRARSVKQALLALVVLFVVRIALVALGATWAIRGSGGVMPFVYGFFGTYFPLQWVEIHYLIAEGRAGGRAEQRGRETK